MALGHGYHPGSLRHCRQSHYERSGYCSSEEPRCNEGAQLRLVLLQSPADDNSYMDEHIRTSYNHIHNRDEERIQRLC
ncbi:hypothetical protein GCM10028825_32840 [Spirosoma agri]